MSLLKLKIGDLEFAPSITGTVITLLLVLLFVHLGMWQLSRMSEKRALEENLQQRLIIDPIQFGEEQGDMIGRDIESFRFQRIQTTGSFLNDQNILLDNKVYQGHAGYNVFTPFLSDDASKLILINRGWIPWGEDRDELPEIKPIPGKVTILGIIDKAPANGIHLQDQEPPTESFPYRVQYLDFDSLSQAFKKPIFDFILNLEQDSPYGFKISPIYFGLSADRHLGYAIQWFTMALATFIYYLVIHLRRL